jgi:hypothetical protein
MGKAKRRKQVDPNYGKGFGIYNSKLLNDA